MIKSILVPIDDSVYSRTALAHAIETARLYKAKIEILNVINSKLYDDQHFHGIFAEFGTMPFPEFKVHLQEVLQERANKMLKAAGERCLRGKVECKTYLITGILADTIAEQAKKVDLIIMGAYGEAAPHKSQFLGGTVEAVVKLSNKPLIIVHDKYQKIKRLLVAFDGSHHAENALRIAADFAAKLNLPIVILTADPKKEKASRIASKAKEYLKSYKVKTEIAISKDEPAKAILNTAKNKNCNFILMGGYGHTKFYELLLGSTTEQVMRKAVCPLLLYR